jgi:hypothetical protein
LKIKSDNKIERYLKPYPGGKDVSKNTYFDIKDARRAMSTSQTPCVGTAGMENHRYA